MSTDDPSQPPAPETATPEKRPWVKRTKKQKSWQAFVLKMNRQLAQGCERHGLPPHKVSVRRKQYRTASWFTHEKRRYLDLVNLDSGEVVESYSDTLDSGRFGGSSVKMTILKLLTVQESATTEEEIDAIRKQYKAREDLALLALVESRAFNRWSSSSAAREMKGLPREERLAAFRKVYNPKPAKFYREKNRPDKWKSKLVNVDERWTTPGPVRVLFKDGKPVQSTGEEF